MQAFFHEVQAHDVTQGTEGPVTALAWPGHPGRWQAGFIPEVDIPRRAGVETLGAQVLSIRHGWWTNASLAGVAHVMTAEITRDTVTYRLFFGHDPRSPYDRECLHPLSELCHLAADTPGFRGWTRQVGLLVNLLSVSRSGPIQEGYSQAMNFVFWAGAALAYKRIGLPILEHLHNCRRENTRRGRAWLLGENTLDPRIRNCDAYRVCGDEIVRLLASRTGLSLDRAPIPLFAPR